MSCDGRDKRCDGGDKRYVSTFRMIIKPRAPCTAQTHVPHNGVHKLSAAGPRCTAPLRSLAPPLFTEPLKDCSVDEGSDIILRGAVSGSLPISVSWLHNGKAVRFGESSLEGSRARLVVRDCLPEDAGAYTCWAENTGGKTSSSAAVCVRDFETISAVKNCTPQRPSPAIMDHEGVSSDPSPKDDLRVFGDPGSPTSLHTQGPGAPCRGETPKKRADSGTAPAVQFVDPPNHVEVRAGHAVRLTCAFRGSSPVVSCWIRNKEQVVDGSELWVESGEQSTTLVIAAAQPEYSGRYTVVLKDRKSAAHHTLSLSVVDRPQPPASSPVVCVLPSGPVLSWSGPCFDGGSAVLGYVVELSRRGPAQPGDWTELTAQCRSTSYRVRSGLAPQEKYCFRVRAYNAVGVSEPSQESQAVSMEQEAEPQEEEFQIYQDVTIDSTHKVTDHYNVLEKLGAGKFGQVFKLSHKETGRAYAGKFYKGRRTKERDAARAEIQLMNHLHHPKLVQCLGAYDNKPEMVMIMELISGGELFERIVDENFEHTEPTSVRYMQQICEGVGFMHDHNIVHLDLKPENIVCMNHTGTLIKIIDFGLARKLDPTTPIKVMHGTPEFVAPEVISYDPIDLSTDMWSIGVICYILLSGESPFQGDSDPETLALVTAAQWEFDEDSFEEISDQAKDFISSLLHKNSRRRMSSGSALAHPWMAAADAADPSTTKSLSKEKMKRFLAKQKWKKTGKALLALKRMALLSKSERPSSSTSSSEECPLSPEAEQALQCLELKLQGAPQFSQTLTDQTVARGSTTRLSCHLTGYPDPDVVWLKGEEPIVESSRVQIEQEDGCCTLVLRQVAPEDSNIYTCRASSEQGSAHCSASLTVKD